MIFFLDLKNYPKFETSFTRQIDITVESSFFYKAENGLENFLLAFYLILF